MNHRVIRAPRIASRPFVACGAEAPWRRRIRGALGRQTQEVLKTEN